MAQTDWRKEFVLAGLLIGFGLLLLPFAVYWVGERVFGQYAPNAGAFDLAETFWWDLMQLSLPAWTLLLCPYLFVQLIRFAHRLLRQGTFVRRVTVSTDDQ
jgi:hypothetical protein